MKFQRKSQLTIPGELAQTLAEILQTALAQQETEVDIDVDVEEVTDTEFEEDEEAVMKDGGGYGVDAGSTLKKEINYGKKNKVGKLKDCYWCCYKKMAVVTALMLGRLFRKKLTTVNRTKLVTYQAWIYSRCLIVAQKLNYNKKPVELPSSGFFNKYNVRFYNETLNQKFWSEDKKFDPGIREKLLSITDDFIDKLSLEGVKIYDITLTGSNSNYNYNEYSDLDVHVLIDFKDINEDEELVKKALDGERFVWNLRHNVSLKGHDVEMYMQDKDEPHVASGLYSLKDDKWITEPSYDPPSIDIRDVFKKANAIETDIEILKEKVLKQEEKRLRGCMIEQSV